MLAAVRPFSDILRWASVVILAGMAVHVTVTTLRSRKTPGRDAGSVINNMTSIRSFITFLGLTALNPWPMVYFVALILGRQNQDIGNGYTFAYIAAIVVASMSWQLFLALCGSALGRLLTSRRGQLITSLISSALIVGLAVNVAPRS